MSIEFRKNEVGFVGVVYEDEITSLRDFLQENSPEQVMFDFSQCDDIHLATLQVVLAYRKKYGCYYHFGTGMKVYQKVCEGFEAKEACSA